MKKKFSRTAVLFGTAVGMLLMGGVAAMAQTESGAAQQASGAKPEVNIAAEKPAGQALSATRKAALAYELFNYGKAAGDALAMVSAATILSSVEADLKVAGDDETVQKETLAADEPPAKTGDASVPDSSAILEEARVLARDNTAIVALIDEAKASGSRRFFGRDRYHGYTTARANSDDPWRWRVARGGELAEVAISGDGDTDLDLFVYDEYGNLICSSQSWSDDEYCSWIPRRTGEFRIVVRNHGNVWNRYLMYIN